MSFGLIVGVGFGIATIFIALVYYFMFNANAEN